MNKQVMGTCESCHHSSFYNGECSCTVAYEIEVILNPENHKCENFEEKE